MDSGRTLYRLEPDMFQTQSGCRMLTKKCVEIPTRALQSWGSATLTLPFLTDFICLSLQSISFSSLRFMLTWYFLDKVPLAPSFITTCQPLPNCHLLHSNALVGGGDGPKLGETPSPCQIPSEILLKGFRGQLECCQHSPFFFYPYNIKWQSSILVLALQHSDDVSSELLNFFNSLNRSIRPYVPPLLWV